MTRMAVVTSRAQAWRTCSVDGCSNLAAPDGDGTCDRCFEEIDALRNMEASRQAEATEEGEQYSSFARRVWSLFSWIPQLALVAFLLAYSLFSEREFFVDMLRRIWGALTWGW